MFLSSWFEHKKGKPLEHQYKSNQDKKFAELERFFDPNGKPRISFIEDHVLEYDKNTILSHFNDDKWQQNIALNIWEYKAKADILDSYPWNVTLPIADVCNARCTFCTSWLAGTSFLKLEDVERYQEVLPYAYHFGYQGHGEPFANPHIKELLQYFSARLDHRCFTYAITNGVFLPKLLDDLVEARINVLNVSLNATTPEIHDKVMGLGPDAFDKIIGTLEKISSLGGTPMSFTISMVLTADNIHQAADFVKLGNDIGASTIYLRTLVTEPILSPGLNYHLLAPKFNEQFEKYKKETLAQIKKSKVRVEAQPETWGEDCVTRDLRKQINKISPPYQERKSALRNASIRNYYKENGLKKRSGKGQKITFVNDLVDNPYNRNTPFDCRFIYYNLISTHLTWELMPCCYMSTVPGYEELILSDNSSFDSYWNSPAYVELRRRLKDGPLYQACATCPMQG